MKSAAKTLSVLLMLYASLLTVIHGINEIRQGPEPIENVFIHAVGAPCQPEAVWHACLPALSILPTYQTAGIGTLFLTGLFLPWGVFSLKVRRRSLLLLALAILLLLAGGGFIAFFINLIAGLTLYQSFSVRKRPKGLTRFFGAFWPWAPIGYFSLVGFELLGGIVNNPLILKVGGVLLPLEFLTLILAMFSALARDGDVSIQNG
jgi:hypothetical protein